MKVILRLYLLMAFTSSVAFVANAGEIKKNEKNVREVLAKKDLKSGHNLAFGVLKGRVYDENGLGMPGANILITDLEGVGTVSDANGYFTILKVPEGQHQLKVSYIGYSTMEQSVTITGGSTSDLKVKLEPGVTIGQEILVLGDRLKGQAKAINQQKNNPNITNIVAADQIGRFPDANVGDALKRIPGITMQNDQGEARDIIVRGMAPQLNSVTINGERVPSAEGDNRRVQLDLIPADMIQTIEVNKALTPDMDADAIGGSVNLVTRYAPDGLRVSGTVASGVNFLSEQPIWTGGLVIGNRVANNKLGYIISASYNNHDFGSDNIEAVWKEVDGVGAVLEEFDIRQYYVQRVRRSISGTFDYELAPSHKILFSAMYNWRDDWENRYRFRVGQLDDAFDDGNFTQVSPGVFDTEGRIGIQTKGGDNSDRVQQRRLEDQRNYNFTLKGDHLFGGKLKADWSVTHARASEDRPNERYIRYRTGGLPVRVDITNPEKPLVTPRESVLTNVGFNEITEEFQETYEEDWNARLDFKLPIATNGILKFGGRFRGKTKVRDNRFFEYEPLDEDAFGATLGDVPTEDQSKDNYLPGDQYNSGPFVSRDFLSTLDLKNGSIFEESDALGEYVPGNFNADENIIGAYVMADYQFTEKFYALAGVRLESTDIDYTGFRFNDDTEEIVELSENQSYSNFLPYLHLKYNFTENNILRFAFTQTLARPDYFNLVPFEIWVPEDDELEAGNPDLSPSVSTNLDLMAESYFKSVGLVSLGGFYKNINDFVYSRVEQGVSRPDLGSNDIELSTFLNGDAVSVYGFEAALQRQLDFLPGFWKGFGVYLNYTYTESETEGIQGREGEVLPLPGTAKNMFNGSLSYENKKLVLRLSVNYASDYLDELGGEAFEDRYYDKQTFVDFNGSYAINSKWRVFAELNNITNQPLRYYQGISSQTMQEEFYNMRMNIGLKFDLFNND